MIRHRRLLLAASAASLALSMQIEAQTSDRVLETSRVPRRYVLPLVGAGVGGLASLVYFWGGGRTLPGTCAQQTCVAIASLGGGAFVGWLIGKEKDELHTLRYGGGKPLRPAFVSVALSGDPVVVAIGDTLVAAIGGGGVQLVSTGARPQLVGTRAAGLRSVSSAAILGPDIALTATGGLYRFPVGPGQGLLLRGPPASIVGAMESELIIAAGDRVERVPRNATEPGDWRGITLPDSVRAIEVDKRGIVWAATSNSLVALRPSFDSLVVVSTTPLPDGVARNISVNSSIAAVALGDSGVRIISISDPEQPQTLVDWRGVRFAMDLTIGDNGKIYVAAGIDGLAVLSLNGSSVRLDGLARELGFIYAVDSDARYVWALDRGSAAATLKRIPLNF